MLPSSEGFESSHINNDESLRSPPPHSRSFIHSFISFYPSEEEINSLAFKGMLLTKQSTHCK